MKQKSRSTGNLALHGGILAATSLLVRLIGFFYRVPLYRILGDEGMGYYSNSFDIYAYVLVVSTYSMPSALSKILSKKLTLKKFKEAEYIFKASLLLSLIIGIITSLLLFFQAENIARLVGSEGSVLAIKALSPSLLIFSILAVFRGYFQGHNTMVPTSISQIIEQVFNAIASLSLAYLLLNQGLVFGAAGGTLGTGIGAAFGLAFVLIIYSFARPTFKKRIKADEASGDVPGLFDAWQIIFMTAAPMLIGSSVYNLSNLVDLVMFQRGLLSHGYEQTFVTSQYGILASKYRLILTLPISIASAMASASIPSLTASLARKEYTVVKKKATMAVKMVLIISIPAAFGLGTLARPILLMLFGEQSLEIASLLLRIGAVSVIFFSLSGISIGILQGLGKVNIPVKHSLIAVVIKVGLMAVALFAFDTGLVGAVIVNVIFSLIVAAANFYSVQQEIRLKLDYKESLIYPLFSAVIMSIVSVTLHTVLISLLGNTLSTLIAVAGALPTYFIVMLKMGGINEADLQILPMGTRLTALLRKMGIH